MALKERSESFIGRKCGNHAHIFFVDAVGIYCMCVFNKNSFSQVVQSNPILIIDFRLIKLKKNPLVISIYGHFFNHE